MRVERKLKNEPHHKKTATGISNWAAKFVRPNRLSRKFKIDGAIVGHFAAGVKPDYRKIFKIKKKVMNNMYPIDIQLYKQAD